jgi:8-oxo-dGTP pyrophosphatase MutT (NUDIX family)
VPAPDGKARRRGGAQVIPRPATVRPGRPAPWAGLAPADLRPSLADVAAALAAAPPPRLADIEGTGVSASAVVAPLYEVDGEAVAVLTRRAQHLRNHRGEVSFPGGRQEPGEDLWRTATREALEEVALDPASVTRIGELDHLRTIVGRSYVVPYVAALPGRPDLTPSPAEVERILHVPLSELLSPGVYREERWGVPPLDRPITFFEVEGDTIWGATGSMLRNLLAVVTGTHEPGDTPRPWGALPGEDVRADHA